jgi:glutamyl-tRNA reductase
VTLLDMDDLRAFAEAGVVARRREAVKARAIVDEEVERFRDASTARQVAPVVSALREQFEAVRLAEVDRAGRKLSDDERAQLDALSRSIVAKLLHEPSVRLRRAGSDEARGQELMAAAARIFDVQGIEAPRA